MADSSACATIVIAQAEFPPPTLWIRIAESVESRPVMAQAGCLEVPTECQDYLDYKCTVAALCAA